MKNTSRLLHKCHCRGMACLSHSVQRPQVSTSGPWACHPCPAGRWQCFWLPPKGLRQRSWKVGGRSPLRCRVLPCWGCLLSEARAGTPLSPRPPGPAQRRANITLKFLEWDTTGRFNLLDSVVQKVLVMGCCITDRSLKGSIFISGSFFPPQKCKQMKMLAFGSCHDGERPELMNRIF